MGKRPAFSNQDQGGLSLIHEKLFQYRDRLPAVRAGQTFQDCVRKENIMAMVRHILYTLLVYGIVESGHDIMTMVTRTYSGILEFSLRMTL